MIKKEKRHQLRCFSNVVRSRKRETKLFFLIQPCETSKVLVILTGVNIILDEQGHVTYYTVPFNLTEIKA